MKLRSLSIIVLSSVLFYGCSSPVLTENVVGDVPERYFNTIKYVDTNIDPYEGYILGDGLSAPLALEGILGLCPLWYFSLESYDFYGNELSEESNTNLLIEEGIITEEQLESESESIEQSIEESESISESIRESEEDAESESGETRESMAETENLESESLSARESESLSASESTLANVNRDTTSGYSDNVLEFINSHPIVLRPGQVFSISPDYDTALSEREAKIDSLVEEAEKEIEESISESLDAEESTDNEEGNGDAETAETEDSEESETIARETVSRDDIASTVEEIHVNENSGTINIVNLSSDNMLLSECVENNWFMLSVSDPISFFNLDVASDSYYQVILEALFNEVGGPSHAWEYVLNESDYVNGVIGDTSFTIEYLDWVLWGTIDYPDDGSGIISMGQFYYVTDDLWFGDNYNLGIETLMTYNHVELVGIEDNDYVIKTESEQSDNIDTTFNELESGSNVLNDSEKTYLEDII